MKNNIKNIFSILSILLIMPISNYIYSDIYTVDKVKKIDKKVTNITLDDAKIILMMNNRGEILNSYTIKNLNNEDVFIIVLKQENTTKTYLIENESQIELIEEF